ncbi:MAG: histidinol-phosphate transaminase, partial [Microbacteriaceae bacterium]
MTRRSFPIRVRAELLEIPAYRQGNPAPEGAFKLSSNENPYPPLPSVLRAVAEAKSFNRYPDASRYQVKALLAEKFGVAEENILLGAGSVALLTQFILTTARDGEVVYSWRSFEAYPIITLIAGGKAIEVPNNPDHSHNLEAMLAALTPKTRAVILCTPNNPTGTVISRADFESFMAQVPSDLLVLLDEAYYEFNTDSDAVDGSDYFGRWPNLVVLRTFSKAYGLAGLRIGYAIGDKDVLALAAMTAVPLSLTQQAAQAAEASLEQDAAAELRERVELLLTLREYFFAELQHIDPDALLDIPHSYSNFIWLPAQEQDGFGSSELEALFLEKNLVVRNLGSGVRITIAEEDSVGILL